MDLSNIDLIYNERYYSYKEAGAASQIKVDFSIECPFICDAWFVSSTVVDVLKDDMGANFNNYLYITCPQISNKNTLGYMKLGTVQTPNLYEINKNRHTYYGTDFEFKFEVAGGEPILSTEWEINLFITFVRFKTYLPAGK